MKENKKTSILIALVIILTLAIILVTVLYITKREKTTKPSDNDNNIELYNLWYVYRQEIVSNDEIIDAFDTNSLYLNITKEKINICDTSGADKTCSDVNYTYNDNNLNISGDNIYFNGDYKLTINNDTMVLEKIENEDKKVSIKFYLQKPSG